MDFEFETDENHIKITDYIFGEWLNQYEYTKNSSKYTSWIAFRNKFLKKSGLELSDEPRGLKIIDKRKYFLAKIKFGL